MSLKERAYQPILTLTLVGLNSDENIFILG